jgi:uncharacterized protein (TIGR00251 family)
LKLSCLSLHKQGLALAVHCQPGAKVSQVIGLHDERLKIALNAPAVENKANEVLVTWLASQLGYRRSEIELLSGQTSRKKRLLIRDGDLENLNRKIIALLH